MSDSPPLLLHVGVAKSGTTTLQNNVFARLPLARNLGRPAHHDPIYRAFQAAVTAPASEWDESVVQPFLDKVFETCSSPTIISDELLRADDTRVLAARLKACFPNAQVLITIRNQVDAVKSHYSNHGWKGNRRGDSRFVPLTSYLDDLLVRHKTGFFGSLHYATLADAYIQNFGRNSVHILPFEWMRDEPDVFFECLAILLQTSPQELLSLYRTAPLRNQRESGRLQLYNAVRRRLPLSQVSIANFLPNSIVDWANKWLSSGRAKNIELSKNDCRKISEIYAHDNCRLSQDFDLPLHALGYPV